MRQGPNKRSRGRNGRGGGGGKPHVPLRMQTFDSSGPDVRIRGNAWQVHERYLTLARDAHQAGDRVAAENFYQHADHYYRLINLNGDGRPPQHGGQHPQHGQPMPPGAPQPGPNGNPPNGQHVANGPANGVEQPELESEDGEPQAPVPVGD